MLEAAGLNTVREHAPRVVGPSVAAGIAVRCLPPRGRGVSSRAACRARASVVSASPPHDPGGADRPGTGVDMGANGGVSGGGGLLADSANGGSGRAIRRGAWRWPKRQ